MTQATSTKSIVDVVVVVIVEQVAIKHFALYSK